MKKLIAISLLFILSFPAMINNGMSADNTIIKKIAVYPSIVPAVKVLETALKYGWYSNGTTYLFKVYQINQADILAGKLANYDVFVIGASGRQYIYGISSLWKKQVQKFIANGGGYLGICGGANEASMGYERPNNTMDYIINDAVLRVANVYINDDQSQEWQYLYKTAGIQGGVPIKCKLNRNHPIFKDYWNDTRIIRYEGGPGMYPANKSDALLGKVIPIAYYMEEPSQKAPIHHWYKKNGEWHMDGNITTDIKGEYAGIATTYGKGRIVLFGPHPEEITMIGGHVVEFPGRSKYTLFREKYLYKWVGGNETSWGYNWWILRRSVAWICNISMPPIDELAVIFRLPNNFHPMVYVDGRIIMPSLQNIIIGGINVNVFVSHAKYIGFYLDGNLIEKCYSPPYKLNLNLSGEHELMVKAFGENSFAYDSIKAIFIK